MALDRAYRKYGRWNSNAHISYIAQQVPQISHIGAVEGRNLPHVAEIVGYKALITYMQPQSSIPEDGVLSDTPHEYYSSEQAHAERRNRAKVSLR